MQLDEAKRQFIDQWGQLGINWGVNKTIGQVHALLLISPEPLCANEIMEDLMISRGNANQTLRELIDWGLVHKKFKQGERKEFFVAEKDIFSIFKAVIAQRKKKELDPMIKVLENTMAVNPTCDKSEEFCKVIYELNLFGKQANNALENMIKSESKWLFGSFMKMMR